MYLIKFEDENNLMGICAVNFKVNPLQDYVSFKDEKGEEVALLKMEKIRGIFKKNKFEIVK